MGCVQGNYLAIFGASCSLFCNGGVVLDMKGETEKQCGGWKKGGEGGGFWEHRVLIETKGAV